MFQNPGWAQVSEHRGQLRALLRSFLPRGWQECELWFPVSRYANTICHSLRENCSVCHSPFLKSFWLLFWQLIPCCNAGDAQQKVSETVLLSDPQGWKSSAVSKAQVFKGAVLPQCCRPADLWKQGCAHTLHNMWRSTVITSLVKQKITFLEASTCRSHGLWGRSFARWGTVPSQI